MQVQTHADDQIDSLHAEIQACSARAKALFEDLEQSEATLRPAPEAWSIAECVEHLTLSAGEMLARIDPALDELVRDERFDGGRYRMSWIGRAMVRSLEPPARSRFAAARTAEPVDVRDSHAVLERFLDLQRELDLRVERARGFAIDRIKIQSPFAKHLHYDVYSALCLILAHERRHLEQAEDARAKVHGAVAPIVPR
jgi:hypothetical protein